MTTTTSDLPEVAPHNLEAEEHVLGAVLLDNDAIETARGLLDPGDFYATGNQIIFRGMLQLADRGEAIDNITLSDLLAGQALLGKVGGATHLAELVEETVSAANIGHHARIVAEKAQVREIRRQLQRALEVTTKADLGQVISLVEQIDLPAGSGNSIRAYRPGPLHESNFKPVQASELLAEVPEPTEWILEDYLATGSLGLIAGKPKEGKTTLIYEAAVKVAQGLPFLGRPTRKGGVLILAVEEHRRDVKLRLQNLGAEGLDGLYVHVGALAPTANFFAELLTFIRDHTIRLVIVDTLAAFWSVENENDASEMTRAVKPLLQLARESEACVLLIHHARKSEGSHGDEIRGSGALFGLVDVALIMKRHAIENQRLLQAQSRYPETPSELILELRESGYVALGDPASVGKAAKKQQLTQALSNEGAHAESITKSAGLTRRVGYRLLDLLVEEGIALREGLGKKSDPYRFKKNSICAPPVPPARIENLSMEAVDLYEEANHAT
ncbi:MAG: AAA family ATPase [Nitrospirales bacterium]